MAKSEAVRLAEIQSRDKTLSEFMSLLRNPVIIAFGTFVGVEYLQKRGYMGEIAGSMLEAGSIMIPTALEAYRSGAFEAMAKVPGDIVEGVAKVAPLLGLLGG